MNNIHESIVLIGGGGGVYRVARFLKHIRPRITTVQTMFDRGNHSGQLRDERGVLPPGDIRQAILALADDEVESDLRSLLTYRFSKKNGSSLDDATVGNILLTALTEITGSTIAAIATLSRWFRVTGKVLPVSLTDADLCVELSDGEILKGEGVIDSRSIHDDRKVARAFLEPKAFLYPAAHEAIRDADKIVFCPGDLFTSIIPNTLVEGFKEAVQESQAQFFFVMNIMTKKSETHRFAASHFAETLLSYIGRKSFDAVIVNTGKVPKDILARYEKEKSYPVKLDKERLKKFARKIITGDFVDGGDVVRHNEIIASVIAGF